jgi:hypothetical protein
MALTKVQIDGVEFSDSTDLNVDSGTLFVDATNNRVGVGTTSPTKKLHVEDTSATSTSTFTNVIARFLSAASNADSNIQFSNGVDHSANIGIAGGANLYFGLDGSEKVRIDSSGRLGLGTSSPTTTLSVKGAALGDGIDITHDAGTAQVWKLQSGISGVSHGYFALSQGSNPRITVSSGGLVGIGTTTPDDTLHLSGSTGYGLKNTDGTHTVVLRTVSGGGILKTASNHALVFGTNDTERARIDSSGRLLVGTTSARSNVKFNATSTTPTAQIETATNSWSNGLSIINNSSSGYAPSLRLGLTGGSSVGSNTLVGSQQLGKVSFHGADGTDIREAASISCNVDGTPGSADMPGKLTFSTTADGASSPTERLRIISTGAFGLSGANYGTSGQVLTSQGSGSAPQWATPAGLTRATYSAATGSAIDFTNIPSTTKRITVMFNGVSLNGGDHILVQLGDSGGLETTGYTSTSVTTDSGGNTGGTNSSSGLVWFNGSAAYLHSGLIIISNPTANVWTSMHQGRLSTTNIVGGGGKKVLSSTLDRIRITRVGSNVFDAGAVNIIHEG